MNRRATFTIVLVLIVLLSQPSLCSEELVLEPAEVSIRADAGQPFGKVSATIRADGRDAERRVADIKLQVGGKSVPIPEKAYRDLASPLLNTLELRTEVGYDKSPWLYIVFQVGFRTADGLWQPKRVHIAYHAGRIESRSIEAPNPDGSTTRKHEKYGTEPAPTSQVGRGTRVLSIKVPDKVAAVYWVTQNDLCTVQISFPAVPQDSEQPKQARTIAWLLKSDGTAIPRTRKPHKAGISKSGHVTESVIHTFPRTARDEAVAVVVSIDDELFTERLIPTAE